MMKKDYAKRLYVNEKKKPPNPKWLLLAIAIFFVIGLGIYGKWISKAPTAESTAQNSFFARVKSWLKPSSPLPIAAKKEEIIEPQVQFSFYNALPKMRIEVPKTTEANTNQAQEKSVNETKTTKEDTGYYLQFGIFKEASRASQVRLSLLLAGIETEIEKNASGAEVTYRVQQGPFSTLSQAKVYEKRWEKKGIDCVIKTE